MEEKNPWNQYIRFMNVNLRKQQSAAGNEGKEPIEQQNEADRGLDVFIHSMK